MTRAQKIELLSGQEPLEKQAAPILAKAVPWLAKGVRYLPRLFKGTRATAGGQNLGALGRFSDRMTSWGQDLGARVAQQPGFFSRLWQGRNAPVGQNFSAAMRGSRTFGARGAYTPPPAAAAQRAAAPTAATPPPMPYGNPGVGPVAGTPGQAWAGNRWWKGAPLTKAEYAAAPAGTPRWARYSRGPARALGSIPGLGRLMPKTYKGYTLAGVTLPLAASNVGLYNKFDHAADYAAAETLAQLKENPLMAFAMPFTPDSVISNVLRNRDQKGVAGYYDTLRQLSPDQRSNWFGQVSRVLGGPNIDFDPGKMTPQTLEDRDILLSRPATTS